MNINNTDNLPIPDKGYTINQVAQKLGVSNISIRRWIKQGKLDATLTKGQYGMEYRVMAIPSDLINQLAQPSDDKPLTYEALINEIALLNQQVGFWHGRYDELNQRLLTAGSKPWYKKLLPWIK